MLNLAQEIATRGYAVDLVLARAQGPLLSQVPDSVRLVDLKASRVLASLPALVRYLRHTQPQTLLAALHYVNLVALWARRLARVPTRVVVSERNHLSREAELAPHRSLCLMPYLIKNFYPWADDIVAVSHGVADDLSQVTRLCRERIKVIYNPVVTSELKEKMTAPLQHPWFAPDQPPVVLAMGRLSRQKDFPTLIRAFARVRQSRPARLLILGEGQDRANLEVLIGKLGLNQEVSLPGFVANPYPYMSRAALFVLSSAWEGLPGVLIEALYCRVPLVSTDCPSGPREILKNGLYGQLVPVGEVMALARAMEKALSGQVQPPPRESWRRFASEEVVEEYLRVLLEG